jgi:hypothetical protein
MSDDPYQGRARPDPRYPDSDTLEINGCAVRPAGLPINRTVRDTSPGVPAGPFTRTTFMPPSTTKPSTPFDGLEASQILNGPPSAGIEPWPDGSIHPIPTIQVIEPWQVVHISYKRKP